MGIYRTRRRLLREHLEDLAWGVLIGAVGYLALHAVLFAVSLAI